MKLSPIIPFEPISAANIPRGTNWVSQIKWDGVRILTYFDGASVKLFNRKLNERTDIFPELKDIHKYCTAKSVILDGEVIAFDEDGKPSFHEVMRRDGIRKLDRVHEVIRNVPIYYMIFDVIYYNGKWSHTTPLKERLEILENIIKPSSQIQLVQNHQDGETLFQVIKDHGLEGIVCKNLDSVYVLNGKNSDWRKVKHYRDLIAVVGGVTHRSGIVNSMLLGLYNSSGEFIYIGSVGTGKLTKAEWRDITKAIEPIKTEDCPFANQLEKLRGVEWLKPVITVKIQYMEWPKGHSIRQPSILAFVEVDPEKCTIIAARGELN